MVIKFSASGCGLFFFAEAVVILQYISHTTWMVWRIHRWSLRNESLVDSTRTWFSQESAGKSETIFYFLFHATCCCFFFVFFVFCIVFIVVVVLVYLVRQAPRESPDFLVCNNAVNRSNF